ncbi:N-acyl amino acid synthase FeeM domain-containing protein [Ensifer soli]|uniref:N-acyl amino acid synthase FeeM domain-containing protein n=1 Tax=Ciceribacter sp. sgz301302 TaxID=3342379 RepID=UPI0035B73248
MKRDADRPNPFSERLLEILDHVEYRRVETSEDMEDVARIRFKAYQMADILPLKGSMLIDEVDFDSHAYVFGIYYDERLISTVRVHHVTPEHRVSSSASVFGREIDAFLDAGMSLIDPVRLAADPEVLRDMPAIPYLTLRVATMASEHFDVDRCLSLVKPQHAAFYKRVFDADTIVTPQKNCGSYKIDLTLLAARVRDIRSWLYRRFPFFDSEPYERRLMFGGPKELPFTPLTVRPTARRAHGAQMRLAPAARVDARLPRGGVRP